MRLENVGISLKAYAWRYGVKGFFVEADGLARSCYVLWERAKTQ